MKDSNYKRLKKFCLDSGADLFGTADISLIKDEFVLSGESIKDLDRAICIGVRLSRQVLNDIDGAPTRLYFHHYRTVNVFLDQLGFKVAGWIQKAGFLSLPIPASQILDWQKQTAHLSHKKIGVLAGLGWLGRNNLLVNPKLGAQFRMATVLTSLKVKVDKPLKKDCRGCYNCLKTCPAGAIQENPQDFKHLLCFEKLKEFQKKNIVSQYVCGVCVRACGGGKKDGL